MYTAYTSVLGAAPKPKVSVLTLMQLQMLLFLFPVPAVAAAVCACPILPASLPSLALCQALCPVGFPDSPPAAYSRDGSRGPAAVDAAVWHPERAVPVCGVQCELPVSLLVSSHSKVQGEDQRALG